MQRLPIFNTSSILMYNTNSWMKKKHGEKWKKKKKRTEYTALL